MKKVLLTFFVDFVTWPISSPSISPRSLSGGRAMQKAGDGFNDRPTPVHLGRSWDHEERSRRFSRRGMIHDRILNLPSVM